MAKEYAWEILQDGSYHKTRRMKVPGGWIYETQAFSDTAMDYVMVSSALCFVPEPK